MSNKFCMQKPAKTNNHNLLSINLKFDEYHNRKIEHLFLLFYSRRVPTQRFEKKKRSLEIMNYYQNLV